MNSFKKLQEEQEEQYKDNLQGIKNSLQSNIGFIGAFSDLFDTYISKFISCLLSNFQSDKKSNHKEKN